MSLKDVNGVGAQNDLTMLGKQKNVPSKSKEDKERLSAKQKLKEYFDGTAAKKETLDSAASKSETPQDVNKQLQYYDDTYKKLQEQYKAEMEYFEKNAAAELDEKEQALERKKTLMELKHLPELSKMYGQEKIDSMDINELIYTDKLYDVEFDSDPLNKIPDFFNKF